MMPWMNSLERPLQPTAASLLIGQPGWVWIAAGICVTTLVVLILIYRRVGWPAKTKLLAGMFKAIGIALIAICLLEPLWSGMRAQPGENIVLLVADSTASLTVGEDPSRPSRATQIRRLLADEQDGWQVRLGQEFQIRRYTLGARIDAIQSFENLDFTSRPTAIGGSLTSLLERYRDQPVAAVLLFTDGNATDVVDLKDKRLTDGPPIFPILPDGSGTIKDITVERTSITQSSFEDAPVTIQADVKTTGILAGNLVARLVDSAGKTVEEQTQPITVDRTGQAFRFQVRPAESLSFYKVVAGLEGEIDRIAKQSRGTEATFANNTRTIAVQREPGPYRVLYVSGRPNWEFKFLRRAITEDTDVNLVGLIRIAKREARFEFLGREGESSNPLFRGFRKDADAETESYDEPVIVALGVKDENELTGGKFPRTRKELFQYHAIILDDVEATFFTPDQQTLLERFVSERGGGLLMLGGPQSFHQGGWQTSPVKDVLPVYSDRVVIEDGPSRPLAEPDEWRFQLSREGWLQPWVRLRSNEPEEQQRLDEMSAFQVISRVSGIKPAAQVLASVVDSYGTAHPALVAQTYGSGRGAALLIGDMWRWAMRREVNQPDDLAKAWRQMVRWLVADVPQRVQTRLEWTHAGDADAVVIRVQVRDEEYQPQENAAVHLKVQPPAGEALTLTAEPSLKEVGVFEATYVPRGQGAYRVDADVQDADGKPLGTASAGWAFEPLTEEFRQIGINHELMEQLATASGGEVILPAGLPAFIESLPTRDVPIQQAVTTPLWHSPWMLTAILLCLAAEWGLRRWRGLP